MVKIMVVFEERRPKNQKKISDEGISQLSSKNRIVLHIVEK